MKRMILRRPRPEDEAAVQAMLAEFAAAGEAHIYGASGCEKTPYADWLACLERDSHEETVAAGLVPQLVMVSFLLPEETPAGFVALRLRLNDALLRAGGHIGYSLRPSLRGQGYGALQLRLALAEARRQGIARVLVTCEEGNAASAATALSQGGAEDVPARLADGSVQRRFWLDATPL